MLRRDRLGTPRSSLKNKPEGYKVWRSKQNSGFCGTRVQVGRYGGELQPDEKCPNCGQREIAEYLMLCPNQDRTRLLKEQTENLEEWLCVRTGRTQKEYFKYYFTLQLFVSFVVTMRLFSTLYLSCRASSCLFADILLQLKFQLDDLEISVLAAALF